MFGKHVDWDLGVQLPPPEMLEFKHYFYGKF